MKHSLIFILCAAVLLFSLTGCGVKQAAPIALEQAAPIALEQAAPIAPEQAAPEAPAPAPAANDALPPDSAAIAQAVPAVQKEEPAPEPAAVEVETPASNSYFYNPHPTQLLNAVSFNPCEVWYEGDMLIAVMHVTNGFNHTVYNIRKVKIELRDANNDVIASGSFGELEGAVIGPMQSILWTFGFSPEAVRILNADMSSLNSSASCSNSY